MFAIALGTGTQDAQGQWLECFFPYPVRNPSDALVSALLNDQSGSHAVDAGGLPALAQRLRDAGENAMADAADTLAGGSAPVFVTALATDDAPTSTAEVYLKLSLISSRQAKPHELNLTGLFAQLPNVAWTSEGAIALDELPARQLKARAEGRYISVNSVDKFPRMADYIVPTGVRIGDASRVRLGAHLGDGTTVMHEGFVNFNAGTTGVSMVEGRISAGVMVGEGSDLGGGCSTMGTLSGGNAIVISVGDQCLLGANSGLGIPLGDRCTVESGLYLTAGSKVRVLNENGDELKTVKARDLAGVSDLLFRRHSQTGAIECLANARAIELNPALHSHN
ncbi:2,3,4,5-tetrahydropyridine-2,6-dicarboxylate N-succinyltransferase [Litorivicinus lipolyticus]|uniref:2,3,4,5-tetrahydropyridine-2,6-dicarboxylate N-succinyltransferase n=1 Tax=Litorivicinus lipolyticus TaxID=418701 RepID=A0A5Q2QD56_9GAMM|nr:DapH/DapD/GlmU-related protein [Litorivicinus lipolyticus]QGG79956.1 2,3,4,5-tetrahydropyridine-2,6-dicarboxylate N-succinyltransferase [Litorivicinus lipolyticus]